MISQHKWLRRSYVQQPERNILLRLMNKLDYLIVQLHILYVY